MSSVDARGAVSSPREERVRCYAAAGHHRMVYDDYGPAESAHAVVCVHGLTRNAGDFARLAETLAAEGWRVLCPDMVGRGRSEPAADPAAYAVPQYLADIAVMLAHARVERVDWVGTSMGGMIGMALAATRGHPIRRLAINDIGARIPAGALRRIAAYVGVEWRFDDFAEGLAHVKETYAPFGLEREADWRRLAEVTLRALPDGGYTNNYDLRLGESVDEPVEEDVTLWPVWDAIRLNEPPLVLRGAESDILEAADLAAMGERGPGARPVTFAGRGHAPSFLLADEIACVRDWLAEEPAGGAR